MMPICRGQRPRLQSIHGERVQKFARTLGLEQSGSYRIIFDHTGQRADADQVIIYQLLWYANDENQPGAHSIFAKGNAGAAASNAKDDLINQIGPRMREGNAVFYRAGVHLLASEHLFEKFYRLIYLPVLCKQLNDLAQCVRRFA